MNYKNFKGVDMSKYKTELEDIKKLYLELEDDKKLQKKIKKMYSKKDKQLKKISDNNKIWNN